jgi:hypothetical protein
MESTREAREGRVRRALAKKSLRVRKSRHRGEPVAGNQGGYMVVSDSGFLVAGEHFEVMLEDLERWVAGEPLQARYYTQQELAEEAPQVAGEQIPQISKQTSRSVASIRTFARAFSAPLRRRQA